MNDKGNYGIINNNGGEEKFNHSNFREIFVTNMNPHFYMHLKRERKKILN